MKIEEKANIIISKKKKNMKKYKSKNILNKRLIIYDLFKDININIKNIRQLLYMKISRDIFLKEDLIKKCYKKIHDIRKLYPSDILTSLHNNSVNKQKFFAINLFRQLLNTFNLHLKPIVYSNGYDSQKKKLTIREFVIIPKKKQCH